TTSWPWASMRSLRWLPMKPAAPVTRIRIANLLTSTGVDEEPCRIRGDAERRDPPVRLRPEPPDGGDGGRAHRMDEANEKCSGRAQNAAAARPRGREECSSRLKVRRSAETPAPRVAPVGAAVSRTGRVSGEQRSNDSDRGSRFGEAGGRSSRDDGRVGQWY